MDDDEPLNFSTICSVQRHSYHSFNDLRLDRIVKSLGRSAMKGITGKVFFTLEEMGIAEALELRKRGWTVESVNEGPYFTDVNLPGRTRAQSGWLVNLPI